MVQMVDLTGRRFGRLTVLSFARCRGTSGRSHIVWQCQCDCGEMKQTRANNLLSGDTNSCGCLVKEGCATKHGMARKINRSPEYKIWCSMKDRCGNPKNKHFNRYGGRGVRVCDEWINDFERFYADLGSRPSPKHSLDRRDNDGNYEPNNCRWATGSEQAKNRPPSKKPSRMIRFNGVALADRAQELGISPTTVLRRFKRGIRGDELFARDLRRRG